MSSTINKDSSMEGSIENNDLQKDIPNKEDSKKIMPLDTFDGNYEYEVELMKNLKHDTYYTLIQQADVDDCNRDYRSAIDNYYYISESAPDSVFAKGEESINVAEKFWRNMEAHYNEYKYFIKSVDRDCDERFNMIGCHVWVPDYHKGEFNYFKSIPRHPQFHLTRFNLDDKIPFIDLRFMGEYQSKKGAPVFLRVMIPFYTWKKFNKLAFIVSYENEEERLVKVKFNIDEKNWTYNKEVRCYISPTIEFDNTDICNSIALVES